MQVVREGDERPGLPGGSVVTVGAYDGVHLGHQAVIAKVRALAVERHLATVVVTFDRHPASVVRPESAPALLTDLDQKLELLEATGVDVAVVVRFDAERATEPAERFVTDTLVGRAAARVVVVGEDFHFGHRRGGNVALLRALGPRLGFEVAPLELVGLDGRPATEPSAKVSSTAVRAALRSGDLVGANEMLGRRHEVRGVVGHGDKRARELGFRTANLEVPEEICLPADGIYAGWYLRPDGETWPAAINVGRRPTFYDDQPYSLVEPHLLGVEDPEALDLYGEAARVRFVERLRHELRFESVADLVAQMRRDCDEAGTVLAAAADRR
jgi:riboflavin kinase/FMN adenylyltransferase